MCTSNDVKFTMARFQNDIKEAKKDLSSLGVLSIGEDKKNHLSREKLFLIGYDLVLNKKTDEIVFIRNQDGQFLMDQIYWMESHVNEEAFLNYKLLKLKTFGFSH